MIVYYKEEGEIKSLEIASPKRSNLPNPFYEKIDKCNEVDSNNAGLETFPEAKSGEIFFESEEVANELGYKEDPYSGKFIKSESYDRKMREASQLPKAFIGNFDNTHIGSGDKAKYIKGIDSPSFISTGLLDYKFGVELETCSGAVPVYTYLENHLSLKSEKDGSLRESDGTLRGAEYVTGILRGDTGMNQLYNICKELGKRCKVDKKCGLHVHIGYTFFTKDFSVFAYILGEKIQNDFFSITPQSRKTNPYCNFLPDLGYEKRIKDNGWKYGIELSYSDLIRNLSNGRDLSSEINKFNPHPEGRWAGSNGRGEIETLQRLFRYKWLNLIPSNFNQRNIPLKNNGKLGKEVPFSIEFRHHSGTLNFKKVKNFVLLCMAFVYYVDNHKSDILESKEIYLEDIIKAAYIGQLQNDLITYVKKRRNKFKNDTQEEERTEYDETPLVEDRNIREIVEI